MSGSVQWGLARRERKPEYTWIPALMRNTGGFCPVGVEFERL